MIVIEILSSKSSGNQVETGLFIKNIGQIDRYKCQRNPQAGTSLETASPDVECIRIASRHTTGTFNNVKISSISDLGIIRIES